MKTSTTALEVAGHLLWVAQNADSEEPVFLTNLHLQKLLFYVQGWALAETGSPMFSDRLEAWPQGPAVYEVWKRFERYGKAPIDPVDAPASSLTDGEKALVRSVWDAYRMYSGPALRDLTHEEPAWIEARRGLAPGARSQSEIPLHHLRSTFAQKLTTAQERLTRRRADLARKADQIQRRAV